MIIDTHCHLGLEDYDDIEQVIKNFEGNIMIISGVDNKTNKEVVNIVNTHDNIYGTLGIHPEYADTYKDEDLNYIEENLNNPKIVGIGEFGLDYHYEGYNKDSQKELMVKQVELAKKYHMPIIIHTRDAMNDTYDILEETKAFNNKITIHCFSESLEMSKRFIEKGCKLGIGGVVTFKNSRKVKEVIQDIDLHNIVLETDSPYLAPEPLRGTKNEPKNVYLVAKKIAELKNMREEDVIKITTENSLKQYGIGENICN